MRNDCAALAKIKVNSAISKAILSLHKATIQNIPMIIFTYRVMKSYEGNGCNVSMKIQSKAKEIETIKYFPENNLINVFSLVIAR